jgi:hypothetical protein
MSTMREALEAAFDSSEKEETPVTEPVETPDVEKTESTPYEVEARAATEPETPVEGEKVEAPAGKPEVEAKPAEKPPEVEEPPPLSWSKEERAHWAKVPKEARAAIKRRDREIETTLNETKHVRKFANDFATIVHPYSNLIRTAGSTPLEAVQSLMNTAAGLSVGNKEQKAQIVAQIIANYAVDVPSLDAILSDVLEKGPIGGTADPKLAQLLAPVYDFMDRAEQAKAAAYERMESQAYESVEEFCGSGKFPYAEELREEMADYLEVAAQRGARMTLEQAYQRAIAGNPTYAKAASQNRRQSEVSQAASTLAKARKASSSVTGSPTSTADGQRPNTLRGALENAWDQHS